MAVLCIGKGKTSFSACHWQSSHNVENEGNEECNREKKKKEGKKKTLLGHKSRNSWVKHKVFANVRTIARRLLLKYS